MCNTGRSVLQLGGLFSVVFHVYTVEITLYTVYCRVYAVQCTQCTENVRSSLRTVHCKVFSSVAGFAVEFRVV